MDEIDDILDGRNEGGRSYAAKPRSRLFVTQEALTLLSYAVILLGEGLDEGPLRSKVLQCSRAALEKAQEAKLSARSRADGTRAGRRSRSDR